MVYLITGAVETLEYFSLELEKSFREFGLETALWDMKSPLSSRQSFEERSHEGDVLVTFNFIGLSGESQFAKGDSDIWEGFDKLCILVDHPLYYYRQLKGHKGDLKLFLIDREHSDFVRRYYPQYEKVHFLPLAGNPYKGELKAFGDRTWDLVFTGSYIGSEVLLKYRSGLSKEVLNLYDDMVSELVVNNERTLTSVMEEYLQREVPCCDEDTYLACMYQMMYVDLSIRGYYREKIVKSAADSGVRMLIVGGGWDKSAVKDYPNVTLAGLQDTDYCLRSIADSRISLNMLPWFKEGIHDRILTSMLCKSAVLSDSSAYMKDAVPENVYEKYDLNSIDRLPGLIREILEGSEKTEAKCEEAYEFAKNNHTWKNRAKILTEEM